MFPYNVYKFSLKRLWGSPITFTILPITIKDFPCNFIVVSLCIVFPYHFYKYGMYFPRKSLHSFAEYVIACLTSLKVRKWHFRSADLGLFTRVHSILEIGVICSQFLTGTDLNFAPVERVLKNLLDTGLWD